MLHLDHLMELPYPLEDNFVPSRARVMLSPLKMRPKPELPSLVRGTILKGTQVCASLRTSRPNHHDYILNINMLFLLLGASVDSFPCGMLLNISRR